MMALRSTPAAMFFVILSGPKNEPLPLVDENEDLATFADESEARAAALQNPLGKTYGFEVYPWA